uniref:Peptidase C45 hydrolase domain-containing protein n=1 Tax=Timema douglasi TaxID=61478 RepID=A0A7R8VZ00_TIMDO|nr:unnamed protein product [Timema douglasi]
MDDILPNVLAQRSSDNTNGCSTVCCNYPGQPADQSPNPHGPSQLARPCSKLAEQSHNPHNPTKLRAIWLDLVPNLLTSVCFVICTCPGFSWSSTQLLPGYSAPGVHHFVELLGHTEDALSETLNHIYFVSAHIISEKPQGRWNVTEERFMSLCYAGHLPGFTMSYNHHGLVFSVNIIMAKTLAAGKTRESVPLASCDKQWVTVCVA